MRDFTRRTLGALALAGIVTSAMPAAAQDLGVPQPEGFPERPIEVVVVYPAGGGMDINARILSRVFERITGAATVVNNRTGGAGLVGHTYLATQAPDDGHTVGVIANLVFADAMLRSEGQWSHTDLEPIAYLNSDGLILVVNAEGPHAGKSMAEIVEAAAAAPGTLSITNVPGSMYEYMIEALEAATGAEFLKVPFQGGAPGIAALLGNNVDVAIAFLGEVRSHIEGGGVTAVAVTGSDRSPFVDAPTMNEVLGTDDFVWQATRWVAVPTGMDPAVKAWLSAAFIAAAADAETQAEFAGLGATTNTSYDTPEAVAAHIAQLAEIEEAFFRATGRLAD
jgi:tripartite-type tricarboxylate transporter receptor subunit TctC